MRSSINTILGIGGNGCIVVFNVGCVCAYNITCSESMSHSPRYPFDWSIYQHRVQQEHPHLSRFHLYWFECSLIHNNRIQIFLNRCLKRIDRRVVKSLPLLWWAVRMTIHNPCQCLNGLTLFEIPVALVVILCAFEPIKPHCLWSVLCWNQYSSHLCWWPFICRDALLQQLCCITGFCLYCAKSSSAVYPSDTHVCVARSSSSSASKRSELFCEDSKSCSSILPSCHAESSAFTLSSSVSVATKRSSKAWIVAACSFCKVLCSRTKSCSTRICPSTSSVLRHPISKATSILGVIFILNSSDMYTLQHEMKSLFKHLYHTKVYDNLSSIFSTPGASSSCKKQILPTS